MKAFGAGILRGTELIRWTSYARYIRSAAFYQEELASGGDAQPDKLDRCA